jgi:UPF0716 protein FxsA
VLGRLLLLFVLVPLVELAILIRVGGVFGFWPTMALVVTTGALGALLARSQGTRVLRAIQHDLAAGRPPAGHLVDGFLILIGGVLLLTPGLLSDIAGLLLLLPLSRGRLKSAVRARFERMVRTGQVSLVTLIR